MAVNLKGSFLTCRKAIQSWLSSDRKGQIVNITSQAAFPGSTTGHADYAASKAGLVTFTRSLAREVVDVVVFLVSARASYITGATIDVTGGMLMR